MDYIEKITTLEKQNSSNKIEKAKLEEREKGLKEEKQKILDSLKELGIKEEDLQSKIDELENTLEQSIEEIYKELS